MARRKKSSQKRNVPVKQQEESVESLPAPGFVSPASAERQIVSAEYSGPIPPPSMLANYGKVGADFPERILKMAEEQLAFERKEIHYINRKFGGSLTRQPIMAFILIYTVILLSFAMIYLGKDVAGLIGLVPSMLAAIVHLFKVAKSSTD